jgi:hypothetical protein
LDAAEGPDLSWCDWDVVAEALRSLWVGA